MSRRISIDIDSEVFEFLQKNATPLLDSPNDVLRRLLLPDRQLPKESPSMTAATAPHPRLHTAPDVFVRELLEREFGHGFSRRPPYRLMFESADAVVYVQNFNKKSEHLWYRVTEKAWRELQSSDKQAWLCLTNPADRFAYIIPVTDVEQRVGASRWSRNYLEININPVASRWVELDWNIERYLKSV